MPDDRCDQSDLPSSMCAHCRGLSLDDPRDVELAYSFEARYISACAICKARIEIGEMIWKTNDGDYVCKRCADA